MNHFSRMSCNRSQRQLIVLLFIAVVTFTSVIPTSAAEEKTKRRRKSRRAAAAEQAAGPRNYRSKNFIMHTDLPKKEAEDLLKRMETMLRLISRYWGAPCRKTIECYVVKDLQKWPPGSLHPRGVQSIAVGGGVTLSQSQALLANDQIIDADAVVYAVAERGVPLHEAVHAYCALTFGRTGPTWYSEGMAEMGNYWRQNDSSVKLEPIVLQYLQNSEIKKLEEIVYGVQNSGDSWREYAWRWALCHLLANNPNYAKRFRPLGLALLNKQNVDFKQVYGAMFQEILFEYEFFIQHLDQGLRSDLISFDWKRKFRKSRGNSRVRAKISAGRGWQPSGLMVDAEIEYQYSVEGHWKLDKKGPELDADGNVILPPPTAEPAGNDNVIASAKPAPEKPADANDSDTVPSPGQLVGIVLIYDEDTGYRLSKPFNLGRYGTFTAPETGNLYLRCHDKWNEIADNSGTASVSIKEQGVGAPLIEPKAEVLRTSKLRSTKK
ncbi:hypothetical protein Mal52_50810 [Symmachiella dynata]|uniref:DUF1570 domain-containing protein n=1 Tax=Symmachiella dynata TaxID=2527995 RepID=A0A517ZVR0_9PLAN|nr:hypothetical protein [Symmachiella dynata]QDU46560.1 hypothetical protein Mal52_50810 [Symmachiella dynata]